MKQRLPALRILMFVALLEYSLPGNTQDGIQEAQNRLRAANAAYESRDYDDYVAHLQAALALNPASLRTRYSLACGYALLGEKERSLDLLRGLADLGVDYGIADDPDLVSLRSESDYGELLRRLQKNVEPVAASRHLVTVEEFGLIPEGIAYDQASGRTFIGSMRNGGIYVVDVAGRLSRFAGLGVPGFSAIGLAVDADREILWAIGTATEFATLPDGHPESGQTSGQTRTSTERLSAESPVDNKSGESETSTEIPGRQSGTPTAGKTGTPTAGQTGTSTDIPRTADQLRGQTGTSTEIPGESEATENSPAGIATPAARRVAARTGVFGFDLATGEPTSRILAHPSIEALNDVTVAPNGDLYVSGSALAVIPAGSNVLQPLTTTPSLTGTNGIVVSSDGATLFTSVYPVGVAAIELANGNARFLELPEDATLYGIDGLYLHEGDLIAIQNGTEPWRLIRIALNEPGTAVTAIRVIERANPHITATTGSISGNEIRYVGQGPAPDPAPSHVPAPLVPFFGQTLIMTAPLD